MILQQQLKLLTGLKRKRFSFVNEGNLDTRIAAVRAAIGGSGAEKEARKQAVIDKMKAAKIVR